MFHLKERLQDKGKFAAIMGAVCTLSEQGFQVFVDSPTRAAPIDLLSTTQEIVFEIDFMPFDFVQRITEYKALFDMLKKYRLDSLVWEVVGGYPLILNALCGQQEEVTLNSKFTKFFGNVLIELRRIAGICWICMPMLLLYLSISE